MTNKVFKKCKKTLQNENGFLKIVCIVLYNKTIYSGIELVSFDDDFITFKKNDNIITIKRNFIKYMLFGFFEDKYVITLYGNKRYSI